MPLSASMRVRLAASQVGANDLGGPAFAPVVEGGLNVANGNGAGRANIL